MSAAGPAPGPPGAPASRSEALRICVVGAGIAGLAAGWEVRRAAPGAELVLLEADERAGGVIRTSLFAGRVVDEGADAFLARSDEGTRLCAELGLTGELVTPATNRAHVYLDGRLVPLPPAHFLGVPLDPGAVGDEVLSPAGVAALYADLARRSAPGGEPGGDPETRPGEEPAEWPGEEHDAGGDCSVGRLVRDRLGGEVLERLVGPLIGSINAGDCDRLSLQAAAPALAEAAAGDASLIRALRRRVADGGGGPFFWGLRGGMERLTEALAERLAPWLALSEPAQALLLQSGGGDRAPAAGTALRPAATSRSAIAIAIADADDRPAVAGVATPARTIACDAVVLAVGAAPTAQLVRPWAPQAAAALARTPTASAAIVTLAYEAAAVPGAREGSGFLVPKGSGLAITACSWASSKWSHLGAPDIDREGGTAILRVSLGRHGDDAIVSADDETLIDAARAGLAATMGVTAAPVEIRVSRWPDAFHQYTVGHLARTAEVEAQLGTAGVFCAGSAYHGIGIPACIAGGRRAARAALAWAARRAAR